MLFSWSKKKLPAESSSERQNNCGPTDQLLDEIDQARADLMLARLETMRQLKAGSDNAPRPLETEDDHPAARPADTTTRPSDPPASVGPAADSQPSAARPSRSVPVESSAATSDDSPGDASTRPPQPPPSTSSPSVSAAAHRRSRQGGFTAPARDLFCVAARAARGRITADDFLDELMSHIVRDDIALHKNELIR